jgi:hypothetical protein
MLMVLSGVKRMAMCDFGVMSGLFMMAGLGVLGRFSMMLCGVFVMVGRLVVMFVNRMLIHNNSSPGCVARTASPTVSTNPMKQL